MKRKFLATLLTLCMTVSLFGCGAKEEAPAAEAPAQTEEAAAPEAEVEARVLTLATTTSPTSTLNRATQYMADGIREATGGAIDIQIYGDSTLGGQVEYLEGISMGTVDMCLIGPAALEDFYDQYAIYGMPFLWKNSEHIKNFLNSDTGKEINEAYKEKTGVRYLCCFDENGRMVWTSKKPVKTLADFEGLKLRVPEVSLFINTFTALGANATVVPLGDLYTGMQTGLVEGYELTISGSYSTSLYEQAKYCTVTNHTEDLIFVQINDDVWNSLTAEQQAIFQEWADKAVVYHREIFEAEYDAMQKEIEESGVEFIELTEEDRAEMSAAVAAIIDELYEGIIDPALLEEIRGM